MRLFHKVLIYLCAIVSFLVIIFAWQENENIIVHKYQDLFFNQTNGEVGHFSVLYENNQSLSASMNRSNSTDYNIWCVFTKASETSPMRYKFDVFVQSLFEHSSVPVILNIITDNRSQLITEKIIDRHRNVTNFSVKTIYYAISDIAEKLSDIITVMQPYFSSQPGTYYSDALFFISLGLHRISNQSQVVLIDVDTKLKTDVKYLFDEFQHFNDSTLFGFAPEQNPVYRHVLYLYRSKHRDTKFGEPLSKGGNPGVNSGVCLLDLDKMRRSTLYNKLLTKAEVERLTDKYNFKGHLGDQDYYTILYQEYRNMVYLLDCTWNRQLCQWWSHHGYKDIFNMFYNCNGKVKIFHGNCNTKIP